MKKSVKVLISLLALVWMLGCTISAAGVLSGDLNGDTSVNSADAIYLLRHTIMPGVYPINQSGDMNGDGNTNGADALYLLRHTILPAKYPLKQNADCAHREVIDPAVAPTCSAAGLTEGKHCENCQMIFVKQETIDPLPHSFERAVCTVCGANAPASEGLAYTLSEDGTYYVITGIGECQDLCIVIPEDYNGIPVKAIGAHAFDQYYRLREVILPDGLTEIGEKAFYITGLSYISIPESVTSIGQRAFNSCDKLKSITLPFADVDAKKGIDIFFPALFGTSHNHKLVPKSLKNVVITGGTEIGAEMFYGCGHLSQITLPKSITYIGKKAFGGCENLKGIHISDVGAWCNVQFADIDAQPLRFAKKLYLHDKLLKHMVIPSGTREIGESAFWGCESILSVRISNNVKKIGAFAFKDCSEFRSLLLPESIEEIGPEAFKGCKKLDMVCYEGTWKDWVNIRIADNSGISRGVLYFYSAKRPKDRYGSYWHYVRGVPTLWN